MASSLSKRTRLACDTERRSGPHANRVHHEYGKHDSNFTDFVWWDMLFGTYRNPRIRIQNCGFDAEQKQQFLAMLKGRDVYRENR